MNRKNKAILKGVASAAVFATAIGDVVDAFAAQRNHAAWYEHYPLESLVTLNFGQRESLQVGRNTDHLGTIRTAGSDRQVYFVKPTDALFKLELTEPTSQNHPVLEEAAALILQQIRSIATTTAPYDKAHAKRILINARSIVALYSMLRRQSGEFEITDTYDESAYWKYLQGGLPNIPYATKAAEMAEFRAMLGAITPLIRNLIPANVDLMERTKWLFSNVFVDSPSAKFSTKQFYCEHFPFYDESGDLHIYTLNSAGLSAVAGTGIAEDPFEAVAGHARIHYIGGSLKACATGLKDMIGEFTTQSMTSRVFGDILKAFGEHAFMQFPDFNPDARTPFVYDEDILNQLQNIAVAPVMHCLDRPGEMRSATTGSTSTSPDSYGVVPAKVVTTYRDTIEPGKLLSMTRFVIFGEMESAVWKVGESEVSYTNEHLTSYGTEVVTSFTYFEQAIAELPVYNGTTTQVASATLIPHWSSDDWAPVLLHIDGSSARLMLDAQNWAPIAEADAGTYHTLAGLSLCMIHEVVRKSDTFVFVQ